MLRLLRCVRTLSECINFQKSVLYVMRFTFYRLMVGLHKFCLYYFAGIRHNIRRVNLTARFWYNKEILTLLTEVMSTHKQN